MHNTSIVHPALLKKQGNFHEKQLNTIILLPTGRRDRLAIEIYSDIKSWFKPKRNGQPKMQTRGYQTSYAQLEKQYGCCRKTIKQKIILLENLGLISREFTNEVKNGRSVNNILNILVWKDTPHFFNEDGLDKTQAEGKNYPDPRGKNYPDPRGKNYPDHISNTTLNTTLSTTLKNNINKTDTDLLDTDLLDNNITNTHAIKEEIQSNQKLISLSDNDTDPINNIECDEAYDRLARKSFFEKAVLPPKADVSYESNVIDNKKNDNDYVTLLIDFKYSESMLKEIISQCKPNRQHYTVNNVIAILQNIIKKSPDKQVFGGVYGFKKYMIAVINGQNDYTEKEGEKKEDRLISIAEQKEQEQKEMDARVKKGGVTWLSH